MDHGLPAVKSIKNLLIVMTYPDHAKKKCPLCGMEEPDLCLLEYFTITRTQKAKVHGYHGRFIFQSCSILYVFNSFHCYLVILLYMFFAFLSMMVNVTSCGW